MEQNIIKRTIVIVLLSISIFLFGFAMKILGDKIHLANTMDYEWLKSNVEIIKNKDIYKVSKDDKIDIYNNNYRKVIEKKYNNKKKHNYKFNNPLLIYNLFGTNILSYNIYFNTKEDTYLKYEISVEDKKINTFERVLRNDSSNNLTREHEYQLIGFVPGYVNKLTLKLKNKDNVTINTKEIKIDLTNVKSNSQTFLDVENGTSKEELNSGLFTILGNDSDIKDYVALYDNDGVLRSEMPIIGYRAHNILFKDYNMYLSISQTKIAKIDRFGRVVYVYKTGNYFLHHDYTFDKDGNILVLANNQDKETEEDCIIKIDLNTKKVTEVLDMEDLFKSYVKNCELDKKGLRDEGEDGLDWIHLNSIEYVNGDVILSSRETSSIIKINDIENKPYIKYILSDKSLWKNTDYEKYVYSKIGDFTIHAGQHSVRYIYLNDNEYYLEFFNNNYGKQLSQPKNNYSKIGIYNNNPFKGDNSSYYKYKVNENKQTFELVNSFKVPYSGIVSSIQTKSNGNIVVDSGTKGEFFEYDSEYNLIRKYKIKLNKYMVYRVLKYSFNNIWFK